MDKALVDIGSSERCKTNSSIAPAIRQMLPRTCERRTSRPLKNYPQVFVLAMGKT